jgi:hypothetical protein
VRIHRVMPVSLLKARKFRGRSCLRSRIASRRTQARSSTAAPQRSRRQGSDFQRNWPSLPLRATNVPSASGTYTVAASDAGVKIRSLIRRVTPLEDERV